MAYTSCQQAMQSQKHLDELHQRLVNVGATLDAALDACLDQDTNLRLASIMGNVPADIEQAHRDILKVAEVLKSVCAKYIKLVKQAADPHDAFSTF